MCWNTRNINGVRVIILAKRVWISTNVLWASQKAKKKHTFPQKSQHFLQIALGSSPNPLPKEGLSYPFFMTWHEHKRTKLALFKKIFKDDYLSRWTASSGCSWCSSSWALLQPSHGTSGPSGGVSRWTNQIQNMIFTEAKTKQLITEQRGY